MLEERLKESQAQCEALQRQSEQLQLEHAIERRAPHAPQPAHTPPSCDAAAQTDGDHPCFGRLLADLGHKKLYLASARNFLHSVPIWAKQRQCNEERVAEIVRVKARRPELMGPIMAFEYTSADGPEASGRAMPSVSCPQPRAIFDGQHRAMAAMRLLSSDAFSIEDGDCAPTDGAMADPNGSEPHRRSASSRGGRGGEVEPPSGQSLFLGLDTYLVHSRSGSGGAVAPLLPPGGCGCGGQHSDFSLVVEVYPVAHESAIKALYLEVNKGESVKEIDLPDTLAPELKAHIDGACSQLQARYPDMFKPSERCRPPHLHRDTLRNKLFQTSATQAVGSATELLTMLRRVNEQLRRRPRGAWPERLSKALDKAALHGLYLGLDDYAWLDMLGK